MRFIEQIKRIESHIASELLYARELALPASHDAKVEALQSDRRLLEDTYHEISKAIDREIEILSK